MNEKTDSPLRAVHRSLSDDSVEAFLATARGQRCKAMLDERVARLLLWDVFGRVYRQLDSLSTKRKHLARDLYGADAWKQDLRPRRLRHCAGMCLAFLVDSEELPLRRHLTRSGKGPRYYWISR